MSSLPRGGTRCNHKRFGSDAGRFPHAVGRSVGWVTHLPEQQQPGPVLRRRGRHRRLRAAGLLELNKSIASMCTFPAVEVWRLEWTPEEERRTEDGRGGGVQSWWAHGGSEKRREGSSACLSWRRWRRLTRTASSTAPNGRPSEARSWVRVITQSRSAPATAATAAAPRTSNAQF